MCIRDRSYLDGRTIRIFSDTFRLAKDCIAGVVHQVENSAAEVLRDYFDQRECIVVFFYDGNIEALVIGADSMVGKPYIFFCQLADVSRDVYKRQIQECAVLSSKRTWKILSSVSQSLSAISRPLVIWHDQNYDLWFVIYDLWSTSCEA